MTDTITGSAVRRGEVMHSSREGTERGEINGWKYEVHVGG